MHPNRAADQAQRRFFRAEENVSAIKRWEKAYCGRYPTLSAQHLHSASAVFDKESVSWVELARRTWREVVDDDVPGLADQLSYHFFLVIFRAILLLLVLASFFPLSNIADDIGRSLRPFVSRARRLSRLGWRRGHDVADA